MGQRSMVFEEIDLKEIAPATRQALNEIVTPLPGRSCSLASDLDHEDDEGQKCDKWSETAVDQMLDKAPKALVESFNDAIRGYLVDRRDGKVMDSVSDMFGDRRIASESKRRLFRNLAWAFDLYATPTPFTFEWVCAAKEEAERPEAVLAFLSNRFKSELLELVNRVSKLDREEGLRIQRKLSDYISTQVYQH